MEDGWGGHQETKCICNIKIILNFEFNIKERIDDESRIMQIDIENEVGLLHSNQSQ